MGKRKKRHIQKRKGQRFVEELRGINLEQVLIVPIDAAKYHPKALVCNYFGDILEDSFFFSVDSKGLSKLEQKIQNCANTWNAKRILIGIESTGHYHEDVVRYLENKGYRVTIINAYTTSEERDSALNWTKTDDLDLAAIASAIIGNKGTESKLPSGIYDKLLTATRARRSEVNKRSTLQIEIRQLMDMIWPGFQGIPKIKNGKPHIEKVFYKLWGKGSCFIMRYYPLPQQVLTLGDEGLCQISREHKLKLRGETIQKLLEAARLALSKQPEDLEVELFLLQMKLDDLEQANKKISALEHKIEQLLVQTPGVLLLSIPEIGMTSAAEFTAEVGPVEQYTYAKQIIKKAGTNPLVDQTGGGEPVYGPISKQGNPSFRTVVRSIGFNLATGKSNHYFKAFAEKLQSKGKKTGQIWIAVGNKFIKVAFALLRDKKLFNPPLWDGSPLTRDVLAKIQDQNNQVVAKETLNSLIFKHTHEIAC